MQLERTGEKVPFLDVHIGAAFFAHGKIWVRTDGNAASVLSGSKDGHQSCCDFLIDGTVRPKHKYGFPNDDLCEEVEVVRVIAAP